MTLRNLYTNVECYNYTASADVDLELEFRIGGAAAPLNTALGSLSLSVVAAGFWLTGGPETAAKAAGVTTATFRTGHIFLASGETVTANISSTNSADTSVDVAVTQRVSAVNVTQVAGTAQTAGDLYAAISGIGTAGGAAVNTDAATSNYTGGITGVTSATTKVGTQTNTYTSTSVLDGTSHVMTHDTQVVDIVYQFLTYGGTTPVGLVWIGNLNPTNDTVTIQAWNHVGGAWETIGTQAGQTSTTAMVTKNIVLYPRHAGTSAAELGKVYVRFQSSAAYNHVLRTDQIYVTYAVTSRTVGYSQGSIWVADVSNGGTAGTELYVNGTADKPCPWANALTISASLGIKRFNVAPSTAYTLLADLKNASIDGRGYTLNMGNKDISYTTITGCELLEGTGTTGTHEAFIVDCQLGDCAFGEVDIHRAHITGSVGLSQGDAAKPYLFHNCVGVGTATINFGARGGADATTCVIGGWSGPLTIAFMQATNNRLYLDGDGVVTIANTCTAGTIYVAGNIKLTNNSTGSTIVYRSGSVHLPDAAAGAAGGLLIDGVNTGMLSLTGGVAISNASGPGLNVSGSTNALELYGTGSGSGLDGAALYMYSSQWNTVQIESDSNGYYGINVNMYGTNGSGIAVNAAGNGTALSLGGSGNQPGLYISGGYYAGPGVEITTGSQSTANGIYVHTGNANASAVKLETCSGASASYAALELIGASSSKALACTGAVTISDGLAITRSTAGGTALTLTGNAAGAGASFTGGTTGSGIVVAAGAAAGSAPAAGMTITGGTSSAATGGVGLAIAGGATSSGNTLFGGTGATIVGGVSGAGGANYAGSGLVVASAGQSANYASLTGMQCVGSTYGMYNVATTGITNAAGMFNYASSATSYATFGMRNESAATLANAAGMYNVASATGAYANYGMRNEAAGQTAVGQYNAAINSGSYGNYGMQNYGAGTAGGAGMYNLNAYYGQINKATGTTGVGLYNWASATSSGVNFGQKNQSDGTMGTTAGMYNIAAPGTGGTGHGMWNTTNSTGSGAAGLLNINTSSSSSNAVYGIRNEITSATATGSAAQYNYAGGSSGVVYGTHNLVNASNSSATIAEYNKAYSVGQKNEATGATTGYAGQYNVASAAASSSATYGQRNESAGGSNSTNYSAGQYNAATYSGGTYQVYGQQNVITSATTNESAGQGNIALPGSGTVYGQLSFANASNSSGIGSSNKAALYGQYNAASSTSTGATGQYNYASGSATTSATYGQRNASAGGSTGTSYSAGQYNAATYSGGSYTVYGQQNVITAATTTDSAGQGNLSISSSGVVYGQFNYTGSMNSSGIGSYSKAIAVGQKNEATGASAGYAGQYNVASGSATTAATYGQRNESAGGSAGTSYSAGQYNAVTYSGSTYTVYGQQNVNINATAGDSAGQANLSVVSNGTVYGQFNYTGSMNNSGIGSYSKAISCGQKNEATGQSAGYTGQYNIASGSATTAATYGQRNESAGGSVSTSYSTGQYNAVTYSGSTYTVYGQQNVNVGSSGADSAGQANLSAVSSGTVYGQFNYTGTANTTGIGSYSKAISFGQKNEATGQSAGYAGQYNLASGSATGAATYGQRNESAGGNGATGYSAGQYNKATVSSSYSAHGQLNETASATAGAAGQCNYASTTSAAAVYGQYAVANNSNGSGIGSYNYGYVAGQKNYGSGSTAIGQWNAANGYAGQKNEGVTSGHGMVLVGAGGSKYGLYVTADSGSTAIYVLGAGDGAAVTLQTAGAGNALYASSASSTAVNFAGGGSFGCGLNITGSTYGTGVVITGGSNGTGMAINGGSSEGNGLAISSPTAIALTAQGGTYGTYIHGTAEGLYVLSDTDIGMLVEGAGANAGLQITGGATGDGIYVTGGATSGRGIYAVGTDNYPGVLVEGGATAHGMTIFGHGVKNGLNLVGGEVGGTGLVVMGGATGGAGMQIMGNTGGDGLVIGANNYTPTPAGGAPVVIESSTGDAVKITAGGGSGVGVTVTGSSYGEGVHISGGTSGTGMNITGGSLAGLGAVISSNNDMALQVIGVTGAAITGSTVGLTVTGNTAASFTAATSHGIGIYGGTTGHGIFAVGGATSGDGIRAAGLTLGHGMRLMGVGASRYDLYADIHGTLDTVTTLTNMPAAVDLTAISLAVGASSGKAPGVSGGLATSDELTAISADIAVLAADIDAAGVTLISPLDSTQTTLTLTHGDAYNDITDQPIVFSSSAWPALGTPTVVTLYLRNRKLQTIVSQVAESVSGSAPQLVTFYLTSTQTHKLEPDEETTTEQIFEVVARFNDGSNLTLTSGDCHVQPAIRW